MRITNRTRRLGPLTLALLLASQAAMRAQDIPVAKFTDITSAAGIRFVQHNGAYGDKLLPETMGGGVAFFDFDNDGYPDLLLINSTDWPGHASINQRPPTMALYHNDGRGGFTDVTPGSGLDVSFYGMGVAVGDYDNDGLPDVFITGVGGNHLFHNQGRGKFREVTQEAGVAGAADGWSTSAAWIDYDNDGKLDLFVCNYVRWSPELDRAANYELPTIGRAYGPPRNFEGVYPYLFHNDGSGHFSDVSAKAGVQIRNPATGRPVAKSLAVAPVDVDNDGWIDLVVANDTVQNFLFHNEHNGTFREIGARSGIAYDAYGLTRGAMGIDSARFRNDDTLGIAIGNFANEMNALYTAQRDSLLFADEAAQEGFGPASQKFLKFGLFFFDYDLDGRLDVLTANGHLEPQINRVESSQQYRQPAQLFWNRGGRKGTGFVAVSPEKCGAALFKPIVGRGSAFADIDGDGDPDVVIAQVAGPPLLLRNDQKLGHHWVRLKLVGKKCNRDAIGAWVRARVAGHTLSRQVMPTRSYLSQSELPITLGLGDATHIDSLEVTWPGGAPQKIPPPELDRLTVVTQEE
ncbi:MAG TPA: CRTAC1 family protein [Verrucomicrobiae bacterium]|nr:CRTAC1 family protein [Verrucomicrobiae bacterium]